MGTLHIVMDHPTTSRAKCLYCKHLPFLHPGFLPSWKNIYMYGIYSVGRGLITKQLNLAFLLLLLLVVVVMFCC